MNNLCYILRSFVKLIHLHKMCTRKMTCSNSREGEGEGDGGGERVRGEREISNDFGFRNI